MRGMGKGHKLQINVTFVVIVSFPVSAAQLKPVNMDPFKLLENLAMHFI